MKYKGRIISDKIDDDRSMPQEIKDLENEVENERARADKWFDQYYELKKEFELMRDDRDYLLQKIEDIEHFVTMAASKCK